MDMYEDPSFSYTIPEDAETVMDCELEVGHEQKLHVRVQALSEPYFVADFGLNHFLSSEHEYNQTGQSVDIARIDCKENTVHKHQFFRRGEEEKTVWHNFAEETCNEDCVKVIHDLYDRAYSDMTENADIHFEEWRGR